jgi:hypothetical protein
MVEPMSQHDDKFARESFTWRRAQPWQLWSITGVVVVLALWALIALT